jgi:AraC-like DNA-binding protein
VSASTETRSAVLGDERMRYWRPAERHAGFVSGYHLYRVVAPPGEIRSDVFQPAGAMLRFVFNEGGTWRIRPPGGRWTGVGEVALFGPAGGVTWSRSGTGSVVGLGLHPRGWVRFTRDHASDWTNRVDAPCEALPACITARTALAAATCDEEIPAILDALLDEALSPPGRGDATIARVSGAILDPAIQTVAALALSVGRSVRALERLANRAFGFPPKLLMRRARFLRSLHAVAGVPPAQRSASIDPGYFDYSHFVRDAHEFLGMSPQAFLKLDNPMLRQSLALRTAVLGAPAQALARDPG